MRLFKLIITLIVLSFLGIFVYQNLGVWEQSVNLKYNLYLVKPDHDVRIYLLVLISLLVGFFMGLTVMMKFHFQTRRKLKRERFEKQQVQAALTQKIVNSVPANPSVTNAPESGTGKEG